MKTTASRILLTVFSTVAFLFVTNTVQAASVTGMWKRKDGSQVKVFKCKGSKLCGKIVKGKSKGLEMFNGMSKSGSKWKGANMKHPSMPGFMTFNGTVRLSGGKLSVKGCAVGQSMCDAEKWSRIK